MTGDERMIQRFIHKWGDKFDPSSLDPRFIPYYNSGDRIKVRMYGQEVTGVVSTSTGWRPAFLLIRRSSDRGSSYVLNEMTDIIAVKRGRQYIPISERLI